MNIVDTRGQACPAPIIAAKRALREIDENGSFIILTDNLTSYNNLIRFLKDNKAFVSVEENSGQWRLTVRRSGTGAPESKPEDYCNSGIAHFDKGDYIVVISSDRMGDGDDELGKILIGNFINALKDLEKLPGKIIFYNRGVTLAAKDSPHSVHLAQLGKMGVEIMLCATCVNHLKLENRLAAGTLSNMFTIAEAMASAGKIIKP